MCPPSPFPPNPFFFCLLFFVCCFSCFLSMVDSHSTKHQNEGQVFSVSDHSPSPPCPLPRVQSLPAPCLPISLPVCHAEPANRHQLALPPFSFSSSSSSPPVPSLFESNMSCSVHESFVTKIPTPSLRITPKPGLIPFKSRSRMKLPFSIHEVFCS